MTIRGLAVPSIDDGVAPSSGAPAEIVEEVARGHRGGAGEGEAGRRHRSRDPCVAGVEGVEAALGAVEAAPSVEPGLEPDRRAVRGAGERLRDVGEQAPVAAFRHP